MAEPFLILHKVRSAPAFDIAEKLSCPECGCFGCDECDNEGFWWIIPTSGHRAYPYWSEKVDDIYFNPEVSCRGSPMADSIGRVIPAMPDGLPDHYPTRLSPSTPALDLISALGIKPSVPQDFKRRV